jgi:hypothetical protein
MTANRTNKNLQAAIRLAEKGMAIIPCKAQGKVAVIKRWQEDATTDPEIIKAWWNGWPSANIAVATGRKSGVLALDVDMKHGKNGEAELRALEQKHGPLPATVESVTPSGGRHLWFRMPEQAISNSVEKIAPGLDLRGDGGYVLVPPSYVVEDYGAGSYTWSVDSASEFADAPQWLIDLACPPVSQLDVRRPTEHWKRIAKGVPAGTRNVSAASLCGYLLRRGIDPETTLSLMLGWDLLCTPPQGPEAILATVESVLAKEIKRRGAKL